MATQAQSAGATGRPTADGAVGSNGRELTALEEQLSREILDLGKRLADRRFSREALKRMPHDRGLAIVGRDLRLRAALFQLVDVAPACKDASDLAGHLDSFLGEVGEAGMPVAMAGRAARCAPARTGPRADGRRQAPILRGPSPRYLAIMSLNS